MPHSDTSSLSTITPRGNNLKRPPPRHQVLDGHLAGAGYRVRSSDLRQVARRLEQLDSVMVNAPSNISQLTSNAVYYNPSDIGSWVDSLLTEFNENQSPLVQSQPSDLSDLSDPSAFPLDYDAPEMYCNISQRFTVLTSTEEDSSIKLVHMLMTCAELVQRGDFPLAGSQIEEMRELLTRVNTGCGIGKVAGYFIDALSRVVFGSAAESCCIGSAFEGEILYHHFYEACPYLKFAHFTANQAILEAFDGHDCVHVIDFNLMHGLQWPALIQALALRPGGPPVVRITGIGPPSSDGCDSLREIGFRLAELAKSVNVKFTFRGVAASRLEDVKPWMLQVSPNEAVAVNSIMQLHRLLGSEPSRATPIETVLHWIKNLKPKIMTVVEQEANHNGPGFLDRFTEALHYYSTMFDSLEACAAQPQKALAEIHIQREICNVLCCEGSARVERHEPLDKWRTRLNEAGFSPLYLGSNAFKQASMLLNLFSAEGFCVEETEGCLTLGWHSRPLIAASAWQAVTDDDPTSSSAISIGNGNNVI